MRRASLHPDRTGDPACAQWVRPRAKHQKGICTPSRRRADGACGFVAYRSLHRSLPVSDTIVRPDLSASDSARWMTERRAPVRALPQLPWSARRNGPQGMIPGARASVCRSLRSGPLNAAIVLFKLRRCPVVTTVHAWRRLSSFPQPSPAAEVPQQRWGTSGELYGIVGCFLAWPCREREHSAAVTSVSTTGVTGLSAPRPNVVRSSTTTIFDSRSVPRSTHLESMPSSARAVDRQLGDALHYLFSA